MIQTTTFVIRDSTPQTLHPSRLLRHPHLHVQRSLLPERKYSLVEPIPVPLRQFQIKVPQYFRNNQSHLMVRHAITPVSQTSQSHLLQILLLPQTISWAYRERLHSRTIVICESCIVDPAFGDEAKGVGEVFGGSVHGVVRC